MDTTQKREVNPEQEADAFERQFRDPTKRTQLVDDLTPQKVLEKTGFREVSFKELPTDWQTALLAEYRSSVWTYGVPFDYKGDVYDDAIFMLRGDGTVLYSLRPINKSFTWARLELQGDRVLCRNINHDSNISEIIRSVANFEKRLPEGKERFAGERGEVLWQRTTEERGRVANLLNTQGA